MRLGAAWMPKLIAAVFIQRCLLDESFEMGFKGGVAVGKMGEGDSSVGCA